MKTIHTAPLELLSHRANGSFMTEPHEAGWADEALLVAYVREMAGPAPLLVLRAQISADGARWIDHPASPLHVRQPGGASLALSQFGNWLRLAGEVSGGPPEPASACVIDLYWVLKG